MERILQMLRGGDEGELNPLSIAILCLLIASFIGASFYLTAGA